jgi:hypothetical protein
LTTISDHLDTSRDMYFLKTSGFEGYKRFMAPLAEQLDELSAGKWGHYGT